MNKPVIAVDIDEVLSPLHDLFFAHHNEVYGTDFPLRDPGGSYFIDYYTGESRETTTQKLKKFIDTEAFQNIQPLEGAIEILAIFKKKYNLVILTGRQSVYYDSTHRWLAQHFSGTFTDVHFIEYVVGVGLETPKSVLCKKVGATYLIDDNLETAIECAKAGLKVVLFGDYPWNQANNLPKTVTRCKDWPAVQEYFNEQG